MSVMWRSVQMHRALAKLQEEIIGLVIQTAVHNDRHLYVAVRPHSSGGFHVQLRLEEGPAFCELCPTGERAAALLCISARCALRTGVQYGPFTVCVLTSRVACDSPYSSATYWLFWHQVQGAARLGKVGFLFLKPQNCDRGSEQLFSGNDRTKLLK